MELISGCFFLLVVLAIAIPAIVVATGARRRADDVAAELERQRAALDALRGEVAALGGALRQPAEAAPGAPPPEATPMSDPAAGQEQPAPEPLSPTADEPSAATHPEALPEPLSAPEPFEPLPEAAGGSFEGAEPPPPFEPPLPAAAAAAALPPRFTVDWESLVGVKLFSWIAGIALALGAVFFLKYSVDHGWLSAPVRMGLGLATGVALLIAGELRVARNYRITANAFHASGIAILYASLFASYALWHLLPAAAAFALMALVTAVAVGLSIRRESVFIALLGLLGGFATPALLSTGQDRPFSLFGYLLLLNAGLAWVGYRRSWPILSVLSLVFTTLYQWAWVAKFLDTSKLPIGVGVFLVFPLVAVAALWLGGRRREGGSRQFEQIASASAVLPLLFAGYLAIVPGYEHRFHLLFFFLFCVDAGLAAIAVSRRGPALLHLLGGGATALVMAIWFAASYTPLAWPSVIAWVALFVVLHATVPLLARKIGRPLGRAGESASYVASLLLFAFPTLAAIEPRAASVPLLFVPLFLLLALLAVVAVAERRGLIFYGGALFAVAAEAIWSARHLSAERLEAALLVYAAFALLFLAVPLLAERRGAPLRPAAGAPALLLLSIALLFFLAAGSVADFALAGVAILLLVLNTALLIASWRSGGGAAVVTGLVLSWLVLLAWWSFADLTILGPAAVAVAGGFAVFIVIASLLAVRSGRTGAADFPEPAWFALVGHAFLFAVASNRELSLPPWPMLAVLGVIALAAAVAALGMRRPQLLGGSVVASHVVLAAWVVAARVSPWPATALLSATILSALAVAFVLLARRAGRSDEMLESRFAAVALLSLVASQLVGVFAAGAAGRPSITLTLGIEMLLVVAILSIATYYRTWIAGVASAAASALVWFTWRGIEYDPALWWGEMVFAFLLYAAFVVWPLVIGRRAGSSREPYLAAVLASAAFFFFAKTSIEWRGWDGAIGLLPLLQGAALLVVLWRLVKIERAGERVAGRLALLAGAVLAFVTVAIPLQFDKEWITIGWALEGAALIWLYRRIAHRGLVAWGTALLAVSFVRLMLNAEVLSYYERSGTLILNWYLYAYGVVALAMYAAARLLPADDPQLPIRRLRGGFAAAGTLLLFVLLNIEIADFFSTGRTVTFDFSGSLAQDLTYTLSWALFAIVLLGAGIALGSRAARVAAIALLLLSVSKCFLHDLMRLGGLYRVGSLVGLAISLAVVALLLQRFVVKKPVPEEAA
jgi:hypothetical protein